MLEKYIESKRNRYIVKRILRSIPIVILATVIIFSLMHLTIGNPEDLATRFLGPKATQDAINHFVREHGLNKPAYEQYYVWANGILHGDWGTSIRYDVPVFDLIKYRVPITLELMSCALLFSIVLGTTMGVIGALKHNSLIDYIVTVQSLFWRSMPSFWLAIIFMMFFAMKMHWLPYGGFNNLLDVKYLILPALALGLRLQAIIARLTRSSMLNVLNKDYMKTARTKGLFNRIVIIKHGLRNALIPVVTVIALRIPWLFSGAVVTESVFNIPGMGRLILMGALKRDFPVIQGVVLIMVVSVVVANLIADILYTYIDPRIDLATTGGE